MKTPSFYRISIATFILTLGLLFIAAGLSGCGTDPTAEQSSIVSGSTPLAVACKVYDNGGATSLIPNFNALTPVTTVFASSMAFTAANDTDPVAAFAGSPASYLTHRFSMSCTVSYSATRDGAYKFSLTSDDGSNMYLSGIKVISNDGLHGATTKTTTQTLAKGSYAIRVDFFENDGPWSLALTVLEPAVAAYEL